MCVGGLTADQEAAGVIQLFVLINKVIDQSAACCRQTYTHMPAVTLFCGFEVDLNTHNGRL